MTPWMFLKGTLVNEYLNIIHIIFRVKKKFNRVIFVQKETDDFSQALEFF